MVRPSKQYGSLQLSRQFATDVQALTAGAGSVELELDPDYRHWFCAVEFYDDAGGLAADHADPTAGTVTFVVTTIDLPQVEQTLSGGDVDLSTGNESRDFAANPEKIKVTLTGISGGSATHYRLRAVGNIS